MEQPGTNGENEHDQTAKSENSFDPLKLQSGDCAPQHQSARQEHQLFGPSSQQMQDNGDSAELRRARNEVQQIRRDQNRQTEPPSQALSNHCENRFLSYYGDPPAHLHISDDRKSTERDR